MRLLQCSQPGSFTLTLYPSDDALPPYAILSHTWEKDDDEVTFVELEDGTYRSKKAGSAKLRFCAEQARRDGIKYFWVDTCCINKIDQNELSEAITSMFRWYRNAQKCYVYLSDVSSAKRNSDGDIQSLQASGFRTSRWFTRGWTLQELLAPTVVEFYSREENMLGTKTNLAQQIHEITTIPLDALQGTPLSAFTIAERIRWSERRDTKRKEDKAYCLLGIFDVFMPLIYGEGDNALKRLRRKIDKKYGSDVAGVLQYSDAREMANVADWYSPSDFADQQTDHLSRRQIGTGDWFLARPEYMQWRQQPNSTLLCPGIPGSGKSVMVATVINDLQTCFESRKDIVVAYLYFNFNRQAEQGLDRMLATLTRQLFQEQAQLPDAVTALYEKHRARATRPLIDEIRNVLQSLLCLYSRVFVVIDALDECENVTRDDLLKELFVLQDSKNSNVNVLATTRFIPDIVQQFSMQPQLEVRADKSDIEVYLASHMTQLARCVSRDVRLQEAITRRIVDVAEGMFLLARLQFDSLRDKTNPGQIKNALARLEKGSSALNGEYAKAVNRIDLQPPGWRELARKVLLWITYATRELSIDELREAVAVNPEQNFDFNLQENLDDEDQVVSVCHGLVEVDRESRVVRLVHYTTQEYFEKVRDQWLPEGHVTISQSCINYLSMNVFAHAQCQWNMDLTTMIKQYKLLEYAGKNWGVHARVAQNEQLHADITNFLLNNDYLRFSTIVTFGYFLSTGKFMCSVSNLTAMHISSHFGLHYVLQGLIRRVEDINCKDSQSQTPLFYATRKKRTEIVQLLLAQPSIEVNTKNRYSETPLSLAVRTGHTEVIQLLLAQPGIEVNVMNEEGETPLLLAVDDEFTEIIRLLLAQPGIDVNTMDGVGRTPLSYAADYGYTEIVRLLLAQPGIDVDTTDNDGRTPLSYAADCGYTEIVRLLLDQPGIEVNAKDELGHTQLFYAANNGHTNIVQLLLAQPGIEVNAKDKTGETPLLRASIEGHTEVVQLLLAQPGIEVNIMDDDGDTPLSSAADYGYTEIVRLLLAQPGIEVNLENKNGHTPLYRVAV